MNEITIIHILGCSIIWIAYGVYVFVQRPDYLKQKFNQIMVLATAIIFSPIILIVRAFNGIFGKRK